MDKYENSFLKLSFFLITIYLGLGMIIWPSWYYYSFQEGGLSSLLFQAQTSYLDITILSIFVFGLILFTFQVLKSKKNVVYSKIEVFLNSKYYLFIIYTLIVLAGFRLIFEGFSNSRTSNQVLEDVTEQQKIDYFQVPVEFIYINNKSITDIYDQIKDKLEIVELVEKAGQKATVESEIGSENIGKIKGSLSKDGEVTTSYSPSQLSTINKTMKIIEELNSKNQLKKIASVELQSEKLKVFNDAITTINSYKISLPLEKVSQIQKEIIENNIKENISTLFKINDFLVLTGKFFLESNDEEMHLVFDYVPTYPSKVQFECDIPTKDIDESILVQLRSEKTWNLKVFGKLIHDIQAPNNLVYKFNCYSIFR